MTTRGFGKTEFEEIANIITDLLNNPDSEEIKNNCDERVLSLTKKFPTSNIK